MVVVLHALISQGSLLNYSLTLYTFQGDHTFVLNLNPHTFVCFQRCGKLVFLFSLYLEQKRTKCPFYLNSPEPVYSRSFLSWQPAVCLHVSFVLYHKPQ